MGVGAAPSEEPTVASPVGLGPEATGIRYDLRLQPDGLIELRIGKFGPWLLSEEQARDFDGALSSMAMFSRDRRDHLRGADRWVFRRESDRLYAKIHDQETDLIPYAVGVQRSKYSQGFVCDGCRASLVKGATAYKAGKQRNGYGHVSWGEVRFCSRCAANTVEARAAKGLRVIDGGRGATG